MILIDTNIIVYSYIAQYEYLKDVFLQESIFISEISRIEVLGYHRLTDDENIYFSKIFRNVPVILPSQKVFDTAINIRRKYNLKLGDSIIAATALVHNLQVCTRNLKDFEKIANLRCFNPVT